MKDLFETKEEKLNAVVQFESLQQHPGWQLLVAIIKQNIEVLTKQLTEGAGEETIEQVQRLRDKLKDHTNFIETPEKMRQQFLNEDENDTSDDPYEP